MGENHGPVNNVSGIWAPLSNISLASVALERSLKRAPNLPGIVALNGPSGYGKTMAAAYCANKFNGVYVECRSFWTPKTLMAAIVKEAGLRPGRTLMEMHDQIVEELYLSKRPLIVDEVDHIAEGKTIQILRDIHDAAHCAVMLIGEEDLPRKLMATERFHNRVLVWQPAAPASKGDTRQLAKFYCPGIQVEDELLDLIYERTRAIVRRICVNLDTVRAFAGTQGYKKVGLKEWGDREIYTGEAPPRRRA